MEQKLSSTMTNKINEFKIIGYIGVDSGMCWIGDPCYILTMPHCKKEEGKPLSSEEESYKHLYEPKPYPKDLGETWHDFCDKFTGPLEEIEEEDFIFKLNDNGEIILDENGLIPRGLVKKVKQSHLNYRQFNYDLGHPGLGVCVGTAYGDGTYPVLARFDKNGRVLEIKIKFD